LTEESAILKRLENDISILCDRVRDLELRAAKYDTVIENRIRQTEGMWYKIVAIATAVPVLILLLQRMISK